MPSHKEAFHAVADKAPVGSTWRHVGNGHVYEVVGACILEASVDPAVLYRQADNPNEVVWARKLDVFLDRFERESD